MTKIKKILIASAWPYAQNVPHLGNLVGSLLSGDVFARYYRLKGYDTLYVSGSDVHGTSIEIEALKQVISPKGLADRNYKKIKKLIEDFEIKFDNYTTTETECHKEFVRAIYLLIEKNGFITTKTEKRAYCENCKKFLADTFICGTCPKCGYEFAKGNQCEKCGILLEAEELIKPYCEICKKKNIIFKETKHWFFDLKKLQPEIEKYVRSHPEWAGNVKNFTENFLKEGLKPRAVTRDIEWGIPAPFAGAKGKTVFVWMEAVIGYISATKEISKDWVSFWFGNNIKQVYTLAKDNIPWHTVIFPAILLASEQGYHLPDQIAATEYLNWVGGEKFSKTRGVGIFMDDALNLLPATYWRFYLLYDRPEAKDTNFSWSELEKTSNQILIGNFGNFINRTLKFVERYYALKIPKAELDAEDKALIDKIHVTEDVVSEVIESGKIKDAIDAVINLCNQANAYFQQREPWKNEDKKDATIYTCVQLVKAFAVFMAPFVPSVSEKIWNILDLDEKLSFDALETEVKAGHIIKKPEIVVEKIDIEVVKEKYIALKKKKQ